VLIPFRIKFYDVSTWYNLIIILVAHRSQKLKIWLTNECNNAFQLTAYRQVGQDSTAGKTLGYSDGLWAESVCVGGGCSISDRDKVSRLSTALRPAVVRSTSCPMGIGSKATRA
jgi:hypothetical protein